MAVLIGDLVRSREHPDREILQSQLITALENTNEKIPALQPLAVTIGDEFQGAYATIGGALAARVLVERDLWEVHRVRFGIGWGRLQVLDAARAPFGQDGPAWWAARDAIDEVRARDRVRSGPRYASSSLRAQDDPSGAFRSLDAMLLVLDHVLGTIRDGPGDGRDDKVLWLLLSGWSLSAIGEELGISHQAVSARARNGGLYALVEMLRRLDGVERSGAQENDVT